MPKRLEELLGSKGTLRRITAARGKRFGLQTMAGGFTWDLVGIRGVNKYDPRPGLLLEFSKDFHWFAYHKLA